jgi:hypothetical protein
MMGVTTMTTFEQFTQNHHELVEALDRQRRQIRLIENDNFADRALAHLTCCRLSTGQMWFLKKDFKSLDPPFHFYVYYFSCAHSYYVHRWSYTNVTRKLDPIWKKVREHWGERRPFEEILEARCQGGMDETLERLAPELKAETEKLRAEWEKEYDKWEEEQKRLGEPLTIFDGFCYRPNKAQETFLRRI